jgi:hypothetical protein
MEGSSPPVVSNPPLDNLTYLERSRAILDETTRLGRIWMSLLNDPLYDDKRWQNETLSVLAAMKSNCLKYLDLTAPPKFALSKSYFDTATKYRLDSIAWDEIFVKTGDTNAGEMAIIATKSATAWLELGSRQFDKE